VVDAERFEHAVDATGTVLREVGQARAEVRRADRRHAQHALGPSPVREQRASIKPAHAVADQVDRLVRKRRANLFAQPLGACRNSRDRLHLRHQNAIAGRPQEFRNALEVRSERERPHSNPRKPEQPVGQDDRRLQPRARDWNR
jgi:hypothetical protein